MSEFSQGVMGDGAAILRNGELVTIDDAVRLLNAYSELQDQMDTLSAVSRTGTVDSIVGSKSLKKIVALMLRDNKEMHDRLANLDESNRQLYRTELVVGPLDGLVEGARRDLESIATMRNSTNDQPLSFALGTVASSCLNTINALHDRCLFLSGQLDSLKDGATVWVNILRGTIGRPAAVDEYFELRNRLQGSPLESSGESQ